MQKRTLFGYWPAKEKPSYLLYSKRLCASNRRTAVIFTLWRNPIRFRQIKNAIKLVKLLL